MATYGLRNHEVFNLDLESLKTSPGHSIDLHFKTYQRWIGDAHEQKMYEIMMGRQDRPSPPN